MVGGSTRIPKIRAMVQEYFNGKNLNYQINLNSMVEATKKQDQPQQVDFVDMVKDYISDTVIQLQIMQHIPEILKRPGSQRRGSKGHNSKGQKNQQQGNAEISWDFDSKEHAREKYGNFNTPIIMKLCSRYNKELQKAQNQTQN